MTSSWDGDVALWSRREVGDADVVDGEASVRFPLPLRWTGAGAWTGLAMAIWERDRPWAVTSVPARTIEVR